MPTRSDFEVLSLIEEAAVLCEAAERDFELLSEDVQKTVRESRRLTEETLVAQDRARRQLIGARARLSDQLGRRNPKAVVACYCKGRLWVCQQHPAVALDECLCGAASVPCSCNPNRTAPPGYEKIGTASHEWSSPRSIRWSSRQEKGDEAHWRDISGVLLPKDGEQVLVRQLYDAEPTLVVFRAKPVARWMSMDGVYIYQFHFFAQWCATSAGPPRQRSAASR